MATPCWCSTGDLALTTTRSATTSTLWSTSIVSSGVPSTRFLEHAAQNLAAFEPVELREQVTSSWEREKSVRTQEEVAELLHDQWPFQFADPHDPRIEEYE